VVAVDAGLMEIEWGKKAVWSVAEAVRYSTADDSDNWLMRKSVPERPLRKLVEVKGSHAIYISQPRAVADLIEQAAPKVKAATA